MVRGQFGYIVSCLSICYGRLWASSRWPSGSSKILWRPQQTIHRGWTPLVVRWKRTRISNSYFCPHFLLTPFPFRRTNKKKNEFITIFEHMVAYVCHQFGFEWDSKIELYTNYCLVFRSSPLCSSQRHNSFPYLCLLCVRPQTVTVRLGDLRRGRRWQRRRRRRSLTQHHSHFS